MSLVNPDLEAKLLSCLMHDTLMPGKLVTAYRGVAGDPSRLFGIPIHQRVAEIIFRETRPNMRVTPSLLVAKNIPLDGFDPQEVYDHWDTSLNNQWREISQSLFDLAAQRKIVERWNHHRWTEPIPKVMEAATGLEQTIREVRTALLPYDPSANTRMTEFLLRRARGELGRLMMTGVAGWDNNLTSGVRVDPGEATVVHGKPKSFKTTLLINLLIGLMRKGISVTHLSAERGYTIHDLVAQYYCVLTDHHYSRIFSGMQHQSYSSVNHDDMMYGQGFSAEEEQAMREAEAEFRAFPLYLYARPPDQGGTGDLATALGWARLDRETRNVQVVLLDNFQSYREAGQNDYELMNEIVPSITDLQSEYGLALFAISQESTAGGVRGSPLDLPGLVNNEIKVEAPEGARTEFVDVKCTTMRSRFRGGGEATFRIHATTGLLCHHDTRLRLEK